MQEPRIVRTELGDHVLVEFMQTVRSEVVPDSSGTNPEPDYVMGLVTMAKHPTTYDQLVRKMKTMGWSEDRTSRAFSNAFEAGYIDYEDRA